MAKEDNEFTQEFKSYVKSSINSPFPSPIEWLESKRKIDNIHGSNNSERPLWRVRENLYDLSSFHNHPGGSTLLEMTKNTDITELFESCHYNITKAETVLSKYLVAECKKEMPRNSSLFTFHRDGFYSVLRKRVCDKLLTLKTPGYFQSAAVVHDLLMILFVGSWLLILHPSINSPSVLLMLEGFCGITLAFLAVSAHTYYHIGDNWRMYTFDLSLNSSYEWRISHVFSHHIFPNSVMDYEVTAFEPHLFFLPYSFKNNFFQPIKTLFAITIIFPLVGFFSTIKRSLLIAMGYIKFRWEFMLFLYFIVASYMLRAFCFEGVDDLWNSAIAVGKRYFVVQCVASFGFIHIGLNAAHHLPSIWHSGDKQSIKEFSDKDGTIDWGVFQMFAVGYRPNVDNNWIISSVSFGQHILHHLFPTVDPALLPHLYPLLLEVCSEFKIRQLVQQDATTSPTKQRSFTVFESFIGLLKQSLRYQRH